MYCRDRQRLIRALKAAIHGPSRTVYPDILAPLVQRIFTFPQFAVWCTDLRGVFYDATRYDGTSVPQP